jgi:hypothetical protein
VNQAFPLVPQRGQKLKYNVVLATGRIFGFSQPLELNSLDSGRVMIREIRRVYYHQLTTRWMRFRLLGISCKRIQIETAAIEINGSNPQVFLLSLSHNDSNKLIYMLIGYATQVIILNSKHQELLTEAFLNPKVIHNHANLVFPSPDQAIVLRPVFDKTRFMYFLILALAVAPILGILAAWYFGRVDTGIDVCVGIFTMMTAVQAVASWAR